MRTHLDIFCAVIDNYGDAGVCWRLARQLSAEFGLSVRLWIDDLTVLQPMHPALRLDCEQQIVANVRVCHWHVASSYDEPADVVIEAFGCELPANYVAAMVKCSRRPIWINLEYLSAESWVKDCHALPSPQANGLVKYFFFPGFAPNTGGLLKERHLLHERRAFQADTEAQLLFLARLGIDRPANALLFSLFAYEHAPVSELFDALMNSPVPVICVIPEGRVVRAAASYFATAKWITGARHQRGALTAITVPFMAQDEYDRLLWCCDLNCVRGEDSFVRAQWAGRPFLWQIYPQQDGAHWPKLDAFLALYQVSLPPSVAAALMATWHAWNGDGAMGSPIADLMRVLPTLQTHAEQWCEKLDRETNLAAALAQFCANQV